MAPAVDAFFLPAESGRHGQRFCLLHEPADRPVRSAIVYVHPFAEEMNKTRRMAALQSRAFAAAGHAVLQIDLLGCGDSSGDFGDATWADWVLDVVLAARWMRERLPSAPLWLWGLRAGCLLAAEAAIHIGDNVNFLFWQSPAGGKTLLQQFLRLRAAGEMLGGKREGKRDSVVQSLMAQLAAGTPVDVAGYLLSPSVALGLERATLAPPPRPGRMRWLEVSMRDEAELSPAAAAPIARWRAAGVEVHSGVVHGPAFWKTVEIAEAPALLSGSLDAVAARTPAEARPASVVTA